jgi:hypothetical protein
MLLAYVDETGGTGALAKPGAHLSYTLGCVLLDEADWISAFDTMIQFRRKLKTHFGIPVRAELKANYLIRGSGPLRPLGLAPNQRKLIFRYHLQLLARLNARAFAVVVDKAPNNLYGDQCLWLGWETLLQRLERTSHYSAAPKPNIMLVHDEGENDKVRKFWRRSRRFLPAGSALGTGSIRNVGTMFLDDPIARASHQSYFIQLADIVAYAAWRSHTPPGASVGAIVPGSSWGHVGSATHAAVNSLRGGTTPGVVVRS